MTDTYDISTDTTIEVGELLEVGADRLSRVCEVVQTVALVVVAFTLLFS